MVFGQGFDSPQLHANMPGTLAIARVPGMFFDLLGLGDVILYLDDALFGPSGPKCDP